jgi:cell wall-active antibiotic response 4TMS protein YvqF
MMQRYDFGTAVFGGTIAVVGVLLLLDRTGALTWPGHWGIWPLLLIGYGLSRMVQSRYEAPRGLFPLALGVWFFGGQARWWSLRETWPLLLVALGFGIAWSAYVGSEPVMAADEATPGTGGTPGMGAPGMSDRDLRRLRRRRRRPSGAFVPLVILTLIVIAVKDNTDFAFARNDAADTTHAIAVLGEARRVVTTDVFTSAQMAAVMGHSDLDLRRTTLPPSGPASIEVNVVMGGATLRVPPDWIVDVEAVPVLGAVNDRRSGATDAAPAGASFGTSRLVITGNVVMGGLDIVSDNRGH